MKTSRILLLLLLLLLQQPLCAQQEQPDHRGVQFATHGTDFWFFYPRTVNGTTTQMSRLYVVSERDCDVTISNPLLDFHQTYHIMHRVLSGSDTNYIDLPLNVVRFADTVPGNLRLALNANFSRTPAYSPQARAFHVTSTDTIALYLFVHSNGSSDGTNVLPTELLRDEYVSLMWPNDAGQQFISIVAAEDSTVVDIHLSDIDWMQRRRGDTVTVTLNRGELYYLCSGEKELKYYPHLPPFRTPDDTVDINPVAVTTHSFEPKTFMMSPFKVDLSGTHIKSRDCKRFAVFEGIQHVYLPIYNEYGLSDIMFDQSLPVRYAGTEFLLPNLGGSDTDYICFVALQDGTEVTVCDPSLPANNSRTFTLDAYQADWFQSELDHGPLYITASHPILVKEFAMGCNAYYEIPFHDLGDPAALAIPSVDWWHNGQVNYGTVNRVDADENHNTIRPWLHVFARTADIDQIQVDDYHIAADFRPLRGTPYSYARYDYHSPYNSEGTHHIESDSGASFFAVLDETFYWTHAIFNPSHVQLGGSYLRVNDIPSDSLDPDSIWCMYDPIRFHGWTERPADSIVWEFGDGHVERYRYEEGQRVTHTYGDTGRYEVLRVITFEEEGCFTMKPDTLRAPIWIHNHYDTSFAVRLCEGSYTFRGHEFSETDTHEVTTYWTASGCDTLWRIALVTCPRCAVDVDSVLLDDLPWHYHGQVYYYPVYRERVHFDPDGGTGDGAGCDSIVTYTLYVLASYDEAMDSVIIMVPNIFTPGVAGNGEENQRFRVVHNERVSRIEVEVFDRRGLRVAKFDGMTEWWDGTCHGQPCQQGAYVYHIRYIDEHNRNWQTMKGTVTLIR